ncbi:MAG: type II secretion system F family protein [Nocardioidaceae bacterium]
MRSLVPAVVTLAATAAWLGQPGPRRRVHRRAPSTPAEAGDALHRFRACWAAGAGVAGWAWVSGWPGLLAGAMAAVGVWVLVGRAEPAASRRARSAAQADLPHLVALLGATLRAGAAPEVGVEVVCAAFPGAAAERLAPVRARLAVGVDPAVAWRDLEADPVLGPVGRALARAHRTGSPVAGSVAALAAELARDNRARAEDRARAVGVRAALPLGLCLLPAFLLIGIVPVVAGLLASLTGAP